jgi:PST family polysaccharide transporter
MALIVIDLLGRVNGLGFSAALVRRPDVTEAHLSTAFWSNLIVGAGLYALAAASAPLVAALFHHPELKTILQVLPLTLLVAPFGMVHSVILSRRLDFRTSSLIHIGALVTDGAVAVLLALNGFGVWSMVLGDLAGAVVTVAAKWALIDWRPDWTFRRDCFRDLFNFGAYATALNIVNVSAANMDFVFTAKYLGAAALGAYVVAYNIATFAFRKITLLAGRVAFPAFARLQGDGDAMRSAYLTSLRYVAMLTYPACAGLFAVAPDLIHVVYTAKWTEAIVPLQILCPAGLLKSSEAAVYSVYQAMGRADLDFKLQLIYLATLGFAVWIGVGWGIVGVAVAVAVVETVFFVLRQYVISRLIELAPAAILRAVGAPLAASAAMAALVWGFGAVAAAVAPERIGSRLAASVVLGVGLYFWLLWFMRRALLIEVIDLLRQQIGGWRREA